MVEQETVISIVVHKRRRIYCSSNMLHPSSLDEADFVGYIGGIQRDYFDTL